MYRTMTFAALLFAGVAAIPVASANGKMNDLEIAHTAYTAGNLDIRYAHLALAMVLTGSRSIAELQGLDGAAFDCAYARNELGYHRAVNQTVADNFIPNVTVPEPSKSS